MSWWQGILIIPATVSLFPSLYGLYRLFLWMKQRGWLSWRNQRDELLRGDAADHRATGAACPEGEAAA